MTRPRTQTSSRPRKPSGPSASACTASSSGSSSGRTPTTRRCSPRPTRRSCKSTGGTPPPILDPFAGGGTIPLEAQRLGLEAHASDLNPVAVLINKALIEIPPKCAGRPGVPRSRRATASWPGATGLADDVRALRRVDARRGREAHRRTLPEGQAVDGVDCDGHRLDLGAHGDLPQPGLRERCRLSARSGSARRKARSATSSPSRDERKRVRFEIGGPDGAPRDGTVGRTGATACCAAPRSRWPTSGPRARQAGWAPNSWPSPPKVIAAVLPRPDRGTREGGRYPAARRRPGS